MHPRQDPTRRCLPLPEWPERDRAAWSVAQQPGNPLEEHGVLAHCAAHTLRKLEQGYGRWLTWLSLHGLLDPDLAPAARVTRESILGYVKDLQALNASYTVLARVQELYQIMRGMAPETDWTWIRRIENRLRWSVAPAREKAHRLVPSRDLLRFGQKLMKRAAGPKGGTELQRACLFRDGLIIALLAARSIRRRNFSSLEIGRHLIRRGSDYWLYIENEETKSGAPYEAKVPDDLVEDLQRYLSVYRPFLVKRTGRWNRAGADRGADNALWVSMDGSRMTEIGIHFRIVKLTKAEFGEALSMHLFRDCASTSIAEDDPEHVLITKSVLNHATLRTSERHYNHARSHQALSRYQDMMMKLRKTSKQPDWKALGPATKIKSKIKRG